jgi:quinol monooxygenase YgiN
MAVRLVVHISAKPGRGSEFGQIYNARCVEIRKRAGCLEHQIYQDLSDPDKFVQIELWESQEALDAHLELNRVNGPWPGVAEVRAESPYSREDYIYNKTA